MSANELRLRIAELLRDELELDVTVQGKRLVVSGDGDTAIVLVTRARTDEELRRDRDHARIGRSASRPSLPPSPTSETAA